MKKKEYEVPLTRYLEVEMEQGFMNASVFEDGKENADGVAIEQHEFAKPDASWEGNYSGFDGTDGTWDKY